MDKNTLLENSKNYIDNLYTEKVVKVPGKLLSTNDFSDSYKEQLDNLDEYKDAFCLGTVTNERTWWADDAPYSYYHINDFVLPTKQYSIYYITTFCDGVEGKIYFRYFAETDEEIIWFNFEGIHLTTCSYNKETNNATLRFKGIYDMSDDEMEYLRTYILPGDRGATTAFTMALDIEELLRNEINTKVDKEDGKGLSSNDFTNAYKSKLDSLELVALPDNIVTTITPNVNNIWVGTEDEYNAITEKDPKILYFIK